MGRKVEWLEVGLAQDIPFEDEVIELTPKVISKEAREKAPTAYGTSYPIRNVDELKRAIQAFGRAPESKRATLKAFIKRRAAELGATNLIPKDW